MAVYSTLAGIRPLTGSRVAVHGYKPPGYGGVRNRAFRRLGLLLCLFSALLSGVACNRTAHAEITTDGSLGPAQSLTGPDYSITADLGQQLGGNLFHSFGSFNINTSESATFSGPVTVSNIISRVTGGSPSNIDGLLRSTIPGADVYLLNPHGVIFGDNASLDVGGSFHASTANYLKLGETGRFDATNPANSVLTTAPPSAFGFLDNNPATINVRDSLLLVPDGADLSLVGGDIEIADGNLYAPDGRVLLASVASPGEVPIDPADMDLNGFESLGTIDISNPSGEFPFLGLGEVGNLDVTTTVPGDVAGGGRIVIRGGEFRLDEGLIRAEVVENVDGGGIDIKVTGAAEFSGDAKLLTRTFVFEGNAGPIAVEADTITLGGDATISSDSGGAGSGGTVTLTADTVVAADRASISADTVSSGNGGSIQITASLFTMSDDTRVKTSTFSSNATGDAGNIMVDADSIAMSGDATINSSTELGSQGQGGRVDIQADELRMIDEAWIISFTETDQDAGIIDVTADTVALEDQSVISTGTFSSGDGGAITINTDVLALQDDAIITSATEGSGSAGDVIINADTITANGNATLSSESEGGNFFVRGEPDLDDATGGGDGGLVQLNAASISLKGNAVVASGTGGAGAGGNVELTAGNVNLLNSGGISAVSVGSGDAGNINITVQDSINMEGGFIRTRAVTADGGNIVISAPNMLYLLDSEITTSVESGFGNGGNITIDPEFVVLNSSQILANAFGGDGGNINIITEHFISSADSVVDASSSLGIDGTINILSPEEEITSNLVELPLAYLDATGLLRERCSARRFTERSSFVVSGRRGVPAAPDAGFSLSGLGSGIEPGDSLSLHETAGPHNDPGVLLSGMQTGLLSNMLAAQFSGCSW
jgi:filamentous hemagglutinin family protein